MGGADVGRQFLRAGLVDEVSSHLAPVLLGGGTRMFDDALGTALPLDIISITPTAAATHLRYAIVRGGRQLARG